MPRPCHLLVNLCMILTIFGCFYVVKMGFISIKFLSEPTLQLDLKGNEDFSKKEIRLIEMLASVKRSCGDVCDTSHKGYPGKYYNHIRKKVNCENLFTNENLDKMGEFDPPPTEVPRYLRTEFSWNGIWKLESDYRDNSKEGHMSLWTAQHIESEKKLFEEGQLQGSYGKESVDSISWFLDNKMPVTDKHVLVIGSEVPWLEAVLLSKGAKKITTFDYATIESRHPQVEVITPTELSGKFFAGIRYDTMVTFSSIEHSGLGRYGDMLNPWGDLITMARAWCLVKPGGLALVGAPTGLDQIKFNSHKLYGPGAYAQIFANWQQIDTNFEFAKFNATGCEFCYQPLYVIKRV